MVLSISTFSFGVPFYRVTPAPTFNTLRTLCTMAKRIIPNTVSTIKASLSVKHCNTPVSSRKISSLYTFRPQQPLYPAMQGTTRLPSYCSAGNSSCMTQWLNEVLFHDYRNIEPPTIGRANQLNLSHRILIKNNFLINFNFRLLLPPNNRAIAHICCHTAIGG